MSAAPREPSYEQILEFCARAPVERVFLEDVARRGLGRFVAVEGDDGPLESLCLIGANLVPSGRGCGVYAGHAALSGSRLIIGAEAAVSELWEHAEASFRDRAATGPVSPSTRSPSRPLAVGAACALRRSPISTCSVPVCAEAHALELGVDPLRQDPKASAGGHACRSWKAGRGSGSKTASCASRRRSSAWTPAAVQVQQVWVDPRVRGHGYGGRGMRDLCRLLLARTPTVTLFVRSENAAAIKLYESIGMRLVDHYRSILF